LPRQNLLVLALGGGQFYSVVEFAHPELDLAILYCPDLDVRRPLYPGHERFVAGSGLFTLGYTPSLSSIPGDGNVLVNVLESYVRSDRERRGCVEEIIDFPAPWLEGGHSGGPVLGEGGTVVGVVIDGYDGEPGYRGRATAIHPLLMFLRFVETL
jgi:hypothetical protein